MPVTPFLTPKGAGGFEALKAAPLHITKASGEAKKIGCVLDGVLAPLRVGRDIGSPIPGAIAWVLDVLAAGCEVYVYDDRPAATVCSNGILPGLKHGFISVTIGRLLISCSTLPRFVSTGRIIPLFSNWNLFIPGGTSPMGSDPFGQKILQGTHYLFLGYSIETFAIFLFFSFWTLAGR
jgi:hypothetical protein